MGGFDRGNYSKEETIQGRKLYEEIRYIEISDRLFWTTYLVVKFYLQVFKIEATLEYEIV